MTKNDLWHFTLDELSSASCAQLEKIILNADDRATLLGALDVYGDKCLVSAAVRQKLFGILDQVQSPGLPASAIRVLRDSGEKSPEFMKVVAKFLNYDLFSSGWYDEVFASIVYYKKHTDQSFEPILKQNYDAMLHHAVEAEDTDLLNFCNY
jgi:hypothetical protein